MKNKTLGTLSLLLPLSVPCGISAQTAAEVSGPLASTAEAIDPATLEAALAKADVSSLVGVTVKDENGRAIGEVVGTVSDRHGDLEALSIELADAVGLAPRIVKAPLESLDLATTEEAITITIDASTLQALREAAAGEQEIEPVADSLESSLEAPYAPMAEDDAEVAGDESAEAGEALSALRERIAQSLLAVGFEPALAEALHLRLGQSVVVVEGSVDSQAVADTILEAVRAHSDKYLLNRLHVAGS